MINASFFEWGGAIFGSAGALLIALNTKYTGWGFVLFFIANIAWIAFGYAIGAHGLILNQIFFTATSLIGIRQWLFKKRLS
jgi:nicotinamide riboside transporter PnuC